MEHSYQVLDRHDDIAHKVIGLHKEDELAVGIMDTGSLNDLQEAIVWYKSNFNHNIHVITQTDRLDKTLLQTLTDITFILFDVLPSLGERINAMANTCMTTYFLMVRSDTDLADLNWPAARTLMTSPENPVVLTPLVFNKSKELVPSVRSPQIGKDGNVEPQSSIPSRGNDANLYPFLGLGLYNRALFQRIRGFDAEIENSYWQALDFGVRSWLYGYPIYSVNSIAVIFFSKQFLIEDRSETEGYSRFLTKTFGVRLRRGKIRFHRVRKGDRSLFSEIKQKVGLYKTDFESLCSNWNT